jgi:uncharacterized protein YndB with AHSA1/START domain
MGHGAVPPPFRKQNASEHARGKVRSAITTENGGMTEPFAKPNTTRVSRIINASREVLYRACLDPAAVAAWRRPASMKAHVHAFDAREGGVFRIALTYQSPEHAREGKTSDHVDIFQGRFIELIPYEKIVERITFEARDPKFAGEMTITTSFTDAGEGTRITILCEDIPPGVRPEDNEMGCEESLRNLAAFVT